MRLLAESSPLPRQLVFPLGILALSLLLVARWDDGVLRAWAGCPWRSLTGWPCPTCGGTHAFIALAHGQWTAALRAHPLLAVLAAAGALWAAQALVATCLPRLRYRLQLGSTEKKAAMWLAAGVFVAAWLHQILRSAP